MTPDLPIVRSALFLNPRCAAPAAVYSEAQRDVLSLAAHASARDHIAGWPGYRPTPLTALG